MLTPRDNHLDDAWQIVRALIEGELDLGELEQRVGALAVAAVEARSESLLAQLASRDDAGNERALRAALGAVASAGSFEDYARAIESELAGIVITAHPTFALSAPARDAVLNGIAAGMSGASRGDPRAARTFCVHRDAAPTLDEELTAADAAIRNIRAALRRVLRIAIDVAAERYPDRYRELKPRLVTVATWVGFDLDGRSDIAWSDSLSCRYRLALDGLDELARAWHALGDGLDRLGEPGRRASRTVAHGIETLGDSLEAGLDALGTELSAGPRLGRLNRLALERRAARRDAVDAIDAALAALGAAPLPDEIGRDVVAFRAEWETFGLALARLHFRVNSVQLHNAIRPEISLSGEPERSASRRTYLAEITALLDKVEPVNVHYGSVARERTTAKRVFMLAAQFCKHFGELTPLRLLIAESDTPFTLLVALYYARLFGIESQVEISPLFETADGLHHGDRVIGELVENPHFLAYLKQRGRFCVQLGFSDSGRYIGQPAASLAIERFKLKLVRLWQRKGLGSIQLVFFDTFGESIGRGGHPRGLADRFLYTHPSEARRQLASLEAQHKHEVSFQGGDGYLWFASPSTSFAVLTELLTARLATTSDAPDALYTESGWALDFFLTLQGYQGRMTEDRGYLELIDALGRNLLYPSGSRPARRQSGRAQSEGLDSIASLRAIPNNAILQQLGYLANSCAGLGKAADQSAETFSSVLERSDRLRRIVALVEAARGRSDITMLEAYLQLTSAGYWLDRSSETQDPGLSRRLRRVSRVLEASFDQNGMARFVRGLRQDAALLDDVLDERRTGGSWPADDPLTTLHVLRLALIQLIYLKAMEVPRFSPRIEHSLTELIERLMRLDVTDTIELLREIFPVSGPPDEAEAYAEQDTYTPSAAPGYAAEHAAIFDPIVAAYGLCLEISALIALHMGAWG